MNWRGVLCKKGRMGCLPWPMVAGQRRERKREELKGINEEECGVLDILGKIDIFRRRYFGNLVEGKKERKRKKKKEKNL